MSINYEYYKIFYYAAKYKNFTQAASALGSSQPNVTRIMKLLETELNCKLFVREPRGIELTDEGKRLYAHVKAAVIRLEHVQEELSVRMPGTGTAVIGATETALHLFLLDALHEFKEAYPKIRIKIQNHTTPEILKNLAFGRLDFAVLTTPFELQKSFVSSELLTFREILVTGTRYANLAEGTWQIEQLKDYPWVGLSKETATYEHYKQFFSERQIEMEPDMEAMTSDLLIPLIRNNLGIGFVPEMLAHPLLQRQILVHIPLACDLPERKICLVFDKDRARNPVSVELQKYLKKYILYTDKR